MNGIKPFCFVLLPPSKAYLNLWDAVIKPAIENSGMTPLRTADVAQRYEDIMEGVRKQIIDAEVIIAVLTDENPTVMYELGMAHAAKKKVIMLLEQDQQPSPNFSHIRVLSYDPTDFPQTRADLTKWLQSPLQFDDLFPELPVKEIAAAPEPLLIAEPSPDIRQDGEVQPLPYTLKQFQIANFHCIVRTGVSDIPVDCPWIFITGENGDGKTSLLQALAIGLNGVQDADHLLDEAECVIDVEIQENGVSHLRHFYWENDHWKVLASRSIGANEPARNLLAYGPARLSIQGEISMDRERGQNSPVYSLLHQTGNLRNIEHWLKDLTLEGIREDGSKDWGIFSRIEAVKKLLVDLMPHVTEIELKGKNVLYKEKGHWVPAHHLGSGHKSILAMIGDMLIRLFEAQPEVTEPQALKGIVLIDELENHLHPRWQREFPQKLSQTFPLVQFIATTHSVLPFLGAPEGSVFLKVSRDEKEGTTVERLDIDVANLLPNSLLTSPLFELDSIVSRQNNDFSQLYTDDDYQEILRQQEREEQLQRYLDEGVQFPKDFLTQDGEGA